MKTRYDREADAMYIKLTNNEVDHTRKIDKNTIIDFAKDGSIIGIEILFVRERVPELLKEFKVSQECNV
ncbi:MAG: DUF2283 domain-containing protein [Nanoarchaeota archaeon]